MPKKNKKERITNLSELLKLYLESKGVWQEGQARYTFGKLFPLEENERESITYIPFKQRSTMTPSYTIVTNAGTMWNTENGKAIERGNLLHEMLGKIITEADIPEVLQQFFIEGRITEAQINPLTSQLKEVVTNPLIRDYYTSNYIIYNEREWLDQAGEYLRPDRVAYQEQKREAIIIDYKTGDDHPQYQTQLKRYVQVLEQMGWRVGKSFLVFINEEITVKIL